MPANQRPLDIIIPFYRNSALAQSLFASLQSVEDEMGALHSRIVAINDSPEDPALRAVLAQGAMSLRAVPCELLENESNEGFVRSVNKGLRTATEQGHDVLLLNSDTLLFSGALAEMRRVATLDPMIGFVSPRSNNATLCSLPHQQASHRLSPTDAYAVFRELSRYLPEYQFVPTAVGFCLLIRFEVLEEFGLLDESYGPGYNEENDLIMRANRCGYRAALANRAFVYHAGEVSFSASATPRSGLEQKNAKLLNERYPEYLPNVAAYFESELYEAEGMLSAMVPDRDGRREIVFDFSSVGPYHNGTFEAAKQLLRRAAVQWKDFFHIFVMASDEAVCFHRLDAIPHVSIVPPYSPRTFALSFRFGQPFNFGQFARMSHAGVVNVYSMLDPIALDCLYLNDPELEPVWNSVFSHADAVLYISEFCAEQFRRRFRRRLGLCEKVCYLSLDPCDYAGPDELSADEGSHILVIGNAFAHKRVQPAVEALQRAFPGERIVALGLPKDAVAGVRTHPSGHLPEEDVRKLLRCARLIVYPSLYEGFGIPVLEGLAFHKPVLVRSTPVAREIRSKLRANKNVILYDSTSELISKLSKGFPTWKEEDSTAAANWDWDAVVRDMGEMFRELIEAASLTETLIPRLRHLRLLGLEAAADAPKGRGVTRLTAELRNREAEVADLRSSLSWRLTAPLRAVGGLYLKIKGAR